MDYLPVFLRVQSQRVLVVGGGVVALRKAESLLQAGAQVTVVAPELCAPLAARVARGGLTHLATAFRAEQLAGAVAAVAATDDRAVNSAVSQAARARGVAVNVVDDAALSSFIFPAIIDRSPILVAVSSSGTAPVLARRVRAQIEALLPARLGALANFMGAQRARVRQALSAWARRAFWERVADGGVATRVLAGDEAGARTSLDRELHAARLTGTGVAAPLGEVYLIGAGPGDPDLLTLRALQLLQQADVILYDRLVAPELLQRARRDAQCIFVGKEAGDSGHQEHIHALLVRLALAGKRVARLKGGDPFVFGRGGEELELLASHGIPYLVVPGITAALGAAAAAEVPLTHRRLAHSVTLVSGHGDHGTVAEWRFFADPAHTVVFYMGVAQLARIVARLRGAGAAAEHPVAIIEQATLPAQRVLRSTLAGVTALAAERQVQPPALLISGNVAAFAAADALDGLGTATAPAGAVA